MSTQATIRKLAKQGITADAHHTQIKKAWKEATGSAPTKDEIEAFRAMAEDLLDGEKPSKTPEELMARAKEVAKERANDEDYPGWENVKSVVQAGKDGMPARVVIKCADPQTLRDGGKICAGTREIAAQDVFQVHRCEPCQKRATVLARNEAAKRRRAEANKATGKRKKAS